MSQDFEVTYACMPRSELRRGALSIRAVQPDHIENIRQWRNQQMAVLRQSAPISMEQQKAYYASNIWPDTASPQPGNILLIYEENNIPIGYGGLVHIAWRHRRAELSFLLDTEKTNNNLLYKEYFFNFIKLVLTMSFEDLGMHRVFTETYANREDHISVLEEAGFHREGILQDHVLIDDRFVDSIIHGYIELRWSGDQ